MSNTTPHLGFPYAEDADARAAWPTSSRQLAEKTEEALTTVGQQLAEQSSPVLAPSGAGNVGIPLQAAGPGSGGFSVASGALHYVGGTRWCLITASAQFQAPGYVDAATWLLTLRAGGVQIDSDVYTWGFGDTTSMSITARLRVSRPVLLVTGQVIQLEAAGTDATVSAGRLEVVTLGSWTP